MNGSPSILPQSCLIKTTIPFIDMGRLEEVTTKDFEILKLHAACREWGIFELVNHGVNPSLLEKLCYEIERFFNLPLEEKMIYKLPGEFEGYASISDPINQNLECWRERFYMKLNPIQARKLQLFQELNASFREILDAYSKETKRVATTLIKLMGKALKIEDKEVDAVFGDGISQSVTMSFYPPCPNPEDIMGLKAHSDASGITILFQVNAVDGLEVKKDGVWIKIKPHPNAFVVNVGDVVEILSNGSYRSAEHRAVLNSVKERISVGMFFNAKLEAEIGPAASLINQQNPPLFKKTSMENYIKAFFSHKFIGKSFLEMMKVEEENSTSD